MSYNGLTGIEMNYSHNF